ncbi:Phosphoribosyl-AMP cyclohydrolase [Candidatus Kinetoplastibacterium sorsogonicusi]|uniref:Phosphoribosyl-AMP cyclohydrolase n=1 Tax=Candidatus Kinetoplastidibacterium kentomonadis TaxID=1576550 RepID=A0A3S7J910_9PROT|nr:phosphoribosyl-AMP cyclohydrolase [Candidatus Kinetoplastibacterium sorsogonicusi]AWD32164.1 Phosphoribosyl-AMP cyclohydrolase [Candidatus Kinetoplastibacterium sorsogonicusi]
MYKNDKNQQEWLNEIKFDENGLIQVIIQDINSKILLMSAWMNIETLQESLNTGYTVYWSRSRKQIWHKGYLSGNFQIIREIRLDCDGDVILMQVEQINSISCHTGRNSCFFRKLVQKNNNEFIWDIVDNVIKDPKLIYSSKDKNE